METMKTEKIKAKREYRNIKVKPETYVRLRNYQNKMELHYLEQGEEVRFSMDDVINALLNLVEMSEIKFDEEEERTATSS